MEENPLTIIPYAKIHGKRNMSEAFIRGLYRQMKDEGKLDLVFYDGDPEEDGFLEIAQESPFFIIVKKDAMAGFVRLSHLRQRTAQGHFCPLGIGFTPIEFGEIAQWLMNPDGTAEGFLDMTYGITPVINAAACSFVRKTPGFQEVGTMPDFVWNEKLQKNGDALISAYKRRA